MGIKRSSKSSAIALTLYALCMGLKSLALLQSRASRQYAPCMGLKRNFM